MTVQEQIQLGMNFHKAGKLAEAEKQYRLALSRHGDHPDALHLLGVIAFQTGNHREAADLIGKALALDPNKPAYHANAALALMKLNRHDEAHEAYQRSVALNPKLALTHVNMGNALAEAGLLDAAITAMERALELEPNHAEALYNLGTAYILMGRRDFGPPAAAAFERAVQCFRKALEQKPDWREAINNLGHTLCRLGRFDEAQEAYRQAVLRRPDCASSHFGYAVMLLRKGEFAQGWREYEWRLRAAELGIRSLKVPMPRWDGGDLSGKTILLCAEQGLGDTIFFSRFVPLVAQRAGKVTVAVQPDLLALLRSISAQTRWIALGEQVGVCDAYCPLPSLPGVMRTNLTNIPAEAPYLRADAELSQKWRARLPQGRPKVGLVWAGKSQQHIDRERSLPLAQLAPLAQNGAWLVSLQKGEAARQVAASKFPIADWTDELKDFSDTAALVDNLDLVVTVDTAVAHLAGAMGKPVWMLLPFVPDWRWMLERNDSPWYPTMRLFRQEKLGDWEAPVSQMALALREL